MLRGDDSQLMNLIDTGAGTYPRNARDEKRMRDEGNTRGTRERIRILLTLYMYCRGCKNIVTYGDQKCSQCHMLNPQILFNDTTKLLSMFLTTFDVLRETNIITEEFSSSTSEPVVVLKKTDPEYTPYLSCHPYSFLSLLYPLLSFCTTFYFFISDFS